MASASRSTARSWRCCSKGWSGSTQRSPRISRDALLYKDAMERALELPQDVEALHALVIAQREMIAQLEQQYRVLAKLVFGRSSEQRRPEPIDAGLQGHLSLADIAAEA